MNGSNMYEHLKQVLEKDELPIPGTVSPTNCNDPYYIAIWNSTNNADEIVVTILGKNMLGNLRKSNEIVINFAQEKTRLADYINKWLLMGKESNRMHRAKVEVNFTLEKLSAEDFNLFDRNGWFTY